MPLYPPPAGTYSEQPPPTIRPATSRASTNNATAEKYRPRTYSYPPPTQPNPTLLGPTQPPYAAQSIQTPYPQQEFYTTAPPPLPMPQPAPIYPPPPHQYPQPVAFRHGSYTQPPRPPLLVDDRDPRSSHSSQRSRPSHDSRRSRHSKHSHDERRHSDGRANRDRRVSIDDIDRRPTMGDSVIAFYKLLKSALGPRDK
jgi:hypothetical protein